MKDGRALVLTSRLGYGAHGTVYQASLTREDLGEMPIAVKLGRGSKSNAKEIAFSREYQLLRACAHPSIINVLEWFGAEDMDQAGCAQHVVARGSAIGFELAASSMKDVLDMVARGGASTPAHDGASTPVSLSLSLAFSWAADVGSALIHLHDQHIMHRDVKPGNVLLFWNPASAVGAGYMQTKAKLADFGLARVMPTTDDPKKRRLTDKQHESAMLRRSHKAQHPMTKAVCTAWYRAPEVFAHTGGINTLEHYDDSGAEVHLCTYGLQVDTWAFGSVVYE